MTASNHLFRDSRGFAAAVTALSLGMLALCAAVSIEGGRAYMLQARLERAIVLAATIVQPDVALALPGDRASIVATAAARVVSTNLGQMVTVDVQEDVSGTVQLRATYEMSLVLSGLLGRASLPLSAAVVIPTS